MTDKKIIIEYGSDGRPPKPRRGLVETIKDYITRFSILTGMTALIASYLTVLATFAFAYFSREKRVVVDINMMGEAKIEALIFMTTSPFVVFTIYYLIKKALGKQKT